MILISELIHGSVFHKVNFVFLGFNLQYKDTDRITSITFVLLFSLKKIIRIFKIICKSQNTRSFLALQSSKIALFVHGVNKNLEKLRQWFCPWLF